jgi:CheY-like chemotaxis protein
MARSVLVVDDEREAREAFAEELTRRGWNVVAVPDVAEALAALRSDVRFDGMVLDQVLKKTDNSFEEGDTILEVAAQEGLALPSVVVITGYVTPERIGRSLSLGVRALIQKPMSIRSVPDMVEAFCSGMDTVPLSIPGIGDSDTTEAQLVQRNDNRMLLYGNRSPIDQMADARVTGNEELLLSREVKARESALSDFISTHASQPFPTDRVDPFDRRTPAESVNGHDETAGALPSLTDEPLLVVARRWNSWYPSFFDVDGGAYAILGAKAKDSRCRAVLIDPGFKALRVLNRLGISAASLDTCIVTHNHPDHVGGFFEYAAARHAMGRRTTAYCSQPVASMLGTYAGSLHVGPFDRTGVEVICPYPLESGKVQMRLVATPVVTSHHTVGHVEGTRGILLSIEVPGAVGHFDCQSTALLLGDTEYQSELGHVNAAIFDGIRRAFSRASLKVAVLHIGCSEEKDAPGKHLYLTGLVDILRDIEDYRQRSGLRAAQKLLVLVSEWGLEHATRSQVLASLPRNMPRGIGAKFNDESLVQKTIDVIKRAYRFETIDLLPADEGLVIGLTSGLIYLDGIPVRPDRVKFKPNAKGLEFYV